MYKLSKEAANDINNILAHSIKEFGLNKTESYYQSLSYCLELLDDNPGMGKSIDELRKGYRYFQHVSHNIFYLSRDREIFIVRILHVQMDFERVLHDSAEEPREE